MLPGNSKITGVNNRIGTSISIATVSQVYTDVLIQSKGAAGSIPRLDYVFKQLAGKTAQITLKMPKLTTF